MEYEFGGPIGALGTVLSLPVVIYALYFLCNCTGECLSLYPLNIPKLPEYTEVEWWNSSAFFITLAWIVWLVVLYYIIPGPTVQGVKLETGERLSYKMNGKKNLEF